MRQQCWHPTDADGHRFRCPCHTHTGVSSIDVEACCTLSDLKHPPVVSRDDDHTGRDDQAAAGRKAPHKIRAVHGLLQPLSKRDAAKDQHVLTVPSVQQQELDAEPLAVEWQVRYLCWHVMGAGLSA